MKIKKYCIRVSVKNNSYKRKRQKIDNRLRIKFDVTVVKKINKNNRNKNKQSLKR